MKGLILIQKEQARAMTLNLVLEGGLGVTEAAGILGLSERHTWRILSAYRTEGVAALSHGNRGRESANRISEEVRQEVVELAQTRYAGFNHTHLTEMLAEREGVTLARSTTRNILVKAGMPSPRRRRMPRHRCRRERMSREGILVQMDGSYHDWLEGRGSWLTLLLAVDDATGTIPYALFQEHEDTRGYFRLLGGIIHLHGVPLGVYTDRHSVFQTSRTPSEASNEWPSGRYGMTQFGRALSELGICQVFARSPEAKGRVERMAGTFQDRLVSELRLAGASTMTEANQVLRDFLPRFNERFKVPPNQAVSAYRPLEESLELESILCFKHIRKVARDNTIKYCWHTLQLIPDEARKSYAGVRAEIQEHLDGKLAVSYQGQVIPTREAPPRPGILRVTGPIENNELAKLPRWLGDSAGEIMENKVEIVDPMDSASVPQCHPTPLQRARWEAIQAAKRRGLTKRAIARELGVSRKTIRKYLEASGPPVNPPRRKMIPEMFLTRPLEATEPDPAGRSRASNNEGESFTLDGPREQATLSPGSRQPLQSI